MDLLAAATFQDWGAYDILVGRQSNLEYGIFGVMKKLIKHNQKDRFRHLIDYYVTQDHDPNDLIKIIGWDAIEQGRYGMLKIMYAGLKRYPPFYRNPDSRQHLNIILWLGMASRVPDRRLVKMLSAAAMFGFTFHEDERVPKLPADDQFQNTRAWVMNRIAKEQIEYRDLDTRGGACLVSSSS